MGGYHIVAVEVSNPSDSHMVVEEVQSIETVTQIPLVEGPFRSAGFEAERDSKISNIQVQF